MSKKILSLGARRKSSGSKPRRSIQVLNPLAQRAYVAPETTIERTIRGPKYGNQRIIDASAEFAEATAGGSRNTQGFWAPEVRSLLGGTNQSITETFGDKATAELTVAARMFNSGEASSAAFITQAKLAAKLPQGMSGAYSQSEVPAEKLLYLAGRDNLNYQKVSDILESKLRRAGWDGAGDAGRSYTRSPETGEMVQVSNPVRDNRADLSMIKSFASIVHGGEVVRKDPIATGDAFDKQVSSLTGAFKDLASQYVTRQMNDNPDIQKTLDAGYRKMRQEVGGALSKALPDRIKTLSQANMEKSVGPKTSRLAAMPSINEMRGMVSTSTSTMLNKKFPKRDDELRAKLKESLSVVKGAYSQTSKSGGIREGQMAGKRYVNERNLIADELATVLDPSQTVASQVGSRENMYDFSVTTDISEAMKEGMSLLQYSAADLQDSNKAVILREVMQSSLEDKGFNELQVGLTEKEAEEATEIQKAVASAVEASSVKGPRQSKRTRTKEETAKLKEQILGAPAPTGKPTPAPVQTASAPPSVKGKNPRAGGQKEWLASNPNIRILAADDTSKQWLEERAGRWTSSTAGAAYKGGKDFDQAVKGTIKGALEGYKEDRLSGFQGNEFTKAGHVQEAEALKWYKETRDASLFSPGLIEDITKPGQATTPDAMTQGGKKIVEVKSRENLINFANPGRDADALKKYNLQMQHQMYLTGAASGDLLQIQRDPLAISTPRTASDYQIDTIKRDEELIHQWKPRWDALGAGSAQLRGSSQSSKEEMTKAIKDGNVAAHLELLQKNAPALGTEVSEAGARGLGGGGGGNGGGSITDVWGRRGGGGSAGQMIQAALARNATGRGVNAALNIAGAVVGLGVAGWEKSKEVNEGNLDLALNAAKAGMTEKRYLNQKEKVKGLYFSDQVARNDIRSLASAAGGLQLGFTGGAEEIIQGTRGLITLGDIQKYKDDPAALLSLAKERGAKRYGADNKLVMAAIGEQSGLDSMVLAKAGSKDRDALNNAVLKSETHLEHIRSTIATALIKSVAQGAETVLATTDETFGSGKPEDKSMTTVAKEAAQSGYESVIRSIAEPTEAAFNKIMDLVTSVPQRSDYSVPKYQYSPTTRPDQGNPTELKKLEIELKTNKLQILAARGDGSSEAWSVPHTGG